MTYVAALLGAALGSCIMDDEVCGENQVKIEGNAIRCECAAGSVANPIGYGCIACGANEIAEGDACVCAPGFGRTAATEPCMAVQGSFAGEACSDTQPCTAPNPFCATEGGESYCTTKGCAAHDQCPAKWSCDTSAGTGFCAKTSGLGASCESSAACAGTDATFCEMFRGKTCMVENCATGENACPSSYACCDLTSVLGVSLCVPTANLTGGMCSTGQPPVKP